MSTQNEFSLAFAGHRPNASVEGRSVAEIAACRPAILEGLAGFRQRAEDNGEALRLIASLAEGADCLAVGCALEQNVPVSVYLPLSADDFAKDFEAGSAALIEMQDLMGALERASGCEVIVPSASVSRPECYARVARQLESTGDALLAICLDLPPAGAGGTRETVDHFVAAERPCLVIDPKTGLPWPR